MTSLSAVDPVNKSTGEPGEHVRVIPQQTNEPAVEAQVKWGHKIAIRLEVPLENWPDTPYEQMRFLRKVAGVKPPYLMAESPLAERRLSAIMYGINDLLDASGE